MRESDAAAIRRRPFHDGTIKPNHRGLSMNALPVSFDVETAKGIPYAMGVRGGGMQEIWGIRRKDCIEHFLELLKRFALTKSKTVVIAGAHNMRFDVGVLLYLWNKEILQHGETITDLEIAGGKLTFHFSRPCFGTYQWGHRTIYFVDTFAYFVMSLDRAAKAIGLKIRKLEHPKGFGVRRFPLSTIAEYLGRDLEICEALLRQIIQWWREYNIRPAISAPQMAARVFQHSFLKKPWVKISDDIEKLALLSYHGGKNGLYVNPGWYPKVYSYDLRSAYSWAMTKLPHMNGGVWEWTREYPQYGDFGFSVIWGQAPDSPYPIFYTHDFVALTPGEMFGPLAVTTMEVEAARRRLKWTPLRIVSVIWRPSCREGIPDVGQYAIAMYDRRQVAETEQEKFLFKLLGNSLYGKFIARHASEEFPGTLIAGSLFYPVVASWITSLVRVKVWESEVTYSVAHTATDGVMSLVPMETGEGLGSWKLEATGPAVLLRNKLYLLFDQNTKRLVKGAYHGFRGDVNELWRILRTGKTEYFEERLNGWQEARRLQSRPFAPIYRPAHLNGLDNVIDSIRRGKGGFNPYRCLIKPHEEKGD